MIARVTMFLIGASVAAALIAGCGGESGAATSEGVTVTTSSLSKDKFVKQAAKLCTEARKNLLNRSLTYLQSHEDKDPTRTESIAAFTGVARNVVLPTIQDEIDGIRKLGAPSGDEQEIAEFLGAEQKAIQEASSVKHLVSRYELERYFSNAAELAIAYGIRDCANGILPGH